jgi:hypothetical protein
MAPNNNQEEYEDVDYLPEKELGGVTTTYSEPEATSALNTSSPPRKMSFFLENTAKHFSFTRNSTKLSNYYDENDCPYQKTACRSWSELPGEIRELIYLSCLSIEGNQVHNIRHYPQGFRRSKRNAGSGTNFSQSYWSFTQTNRQIRAEFTPWLRNQRRISTPLATVNSYIDLFNPIDEKTGTRTGWIEPIEPACVGSPLPSEGVEVLDLLKNAYSDPDFHLELIPEPPGMHPRSADELTILGHLKCHILPNGILLQACGITGITLRTCATSPNFRGYFTDYPRDEQSQKHHIVLDLAVQPTLTVDGIPRTPAQQRRCIEYWLFEEAKLARYEGLEIHTNIGSTNTEWKVTQSGIMIRYEKEQCSDERPFVSFFALQRKTCMFESGGSFITIHERRAR